MTGYCFNFMPIISGSFGPASYRFTPNDLVTVNGWTNISGVFSVFNVGQNVKLSGALQLGSQIVAVASAILYHAF